MAQFQLVVASNEEINLNSLSNVMMRATEMTESEYESRKAKASREGRRRLPRMESSFYVVPALADLIARIIAFDNQNLRVDRPTEVMRVIKVNRYISDFDLRFNKADYVILEGMYIVAEGYLLPIEPVESCWGDPYNTNKLPRPEEFGLPREGLAKYSTMKKISKDSFFVLKDNWLTNRVYSHDQWNYVYV